MATERSRQSRRRFLWTGAGTLAAAGIARGVEAAEWTGAEKANVQVVNAFCDAWRTRDATKIVSFFDANVVYRATETAEPVKGRDTVGEQIRKFVDRVDRFEVLETFAKGPMVFNERIDHFNGGQLRSWRGVGVFFLKDGKIVDWYDYTIAMNRA